MNRDAFLQAIRDAPEDDGPRLIYADWLEEHADTVALDSAVDEVRKRYGNSAVTRGVLVGRDPGLEMPHLPD